MEEFGRKFLNMIDDNSKIFLFWWSTDGMEYSNVEIFEDNLGFSVSLDEDFILDSVYLSNN